MKVLRASVQCGLHFCCSGRWSAAGDAHQASLSPRVAPGGPAAYLGASPILASGACWKRPGTPEGQATEPYALGINPRPWGARDAGRTKPYLPWQ